MKRSRGSQALDGVCQLCKLCDDCPEKYGDKIIVPEHNLTIHYFCLLMSSGIYQRGDEDEGIRGFLVEDILREIQRASRLRCSGCKGNGASIGCSLKTCRKKVHFPCGVNQGFLYQFCDSFPSFCKDHRPTQTCSVHPTEPLACSVCLETIETSLSYSVLKCPACHGSWFHRECVQRQAHNAGHYFFRCTICNNQDSFHKEMLRMGIHIPERDASWELDENAYSELLQVYQHCDAFTCRSSVGRDFSAQSGKFEIIRCSVCGSKGTHRTCSSLKANQNNWVCSECKAIDEGTATLPRHLQSPISERQRKRKRPVSMAKRRMLQPTAQGILQELSAGISEDEERGGNGEQLGSVVKVLDSKVMEAALGLLRRHDFTPEARLAVRFSSDHQCYSNSALRRFFRLVQQDMQKSAIFKGPPGEKSLALDSQAVRQDLYYEMGCLLALSMVHGGPPPSFFSKPLYFSLFHFPKDFMFSISDINETWLVDKLKKIKDVKSMHRLENVLESMSDYLEVAGCMRKVENVHDRYSLIDDILNFHIMVRMQLPLQRFRDGLRTLGVFEQIQMAPDKFYHMFCFPPEKLCATSLNAMFTHQFSERTDYRTKEMETAKHWEQFLLDCEEGKCASSLEDVLLFTTSCDTVPAKGFLPAPTLSFLSVADPSFAFPQRQPDTNHILLPVTPFYTVFKKNMEYAVCQFTVMQDA